MRKLSKKISMLMVLAMLVSLFSGIVSASAASAWSFKSAKYDVDVNETIEMEKNEYADFDLFKNDAAPTGYTVKWASNNPDAVWVNAKTGQLRADKFGTADLGDKATISATFTNTATKKSATRSFVIVVAEKAAYTLTTKVGEAVLGAEALTVGTEYALTSTVTADGKAVDATVAYTVNGVAVTALKFDAAGEYTVVATATVGGKVVATVKTAVVAAKANTSIAQISMTKALLVLGSEAVAKSVADNGNVAATYTIKDSTYVIESLVKSVKVDETNKAAVVVEMYDQFVPEATYTIKVGENGSNFVAATAKVEDIARIAVQANKYVVNQAEALKVSVFDAKNVDITDAKAIQEFLSFYLTWELADTETIICDLQAGNIQFFEANKSAVVKAKLHMGYNDDGTEKEAKTATGTVTSIPASSDGKIVGFATDPGYYDAANQNVNYTNNTIELIAGEGVTTLWAKFQQFDRWNNATDVFIVAGSAYTQDWSNTDGAYRNNGYTYRSSNNDVCYVDNTLGTLQPAKAGTAKIYVMDPNGAVMGSVSVLVHAEQQLKNFTVTTSKTNLSANLAAGETDSVRIKLNAVDQLGRPYNFNSAAVVWEVTFAETSNTLTRSNFTALNPVTLTADNGSYYFDLSATSFGTLAAGTKKPITLTFSVKDADDYANARVIKRSIGINVKNVNQGTTGTAYLALDQKVIDTKLNQGGTWAYEAPIAAEIRDNEGYKLKAISYTANYTTAVATGSGYTVMISKNEGTVPAADQTFITPGDKVAAVKVTGSVVTKIGNGTYRFRLYDNAGNLKDTEVVVIRDTTGGITVDRASTTIKRAFTADANKIKDSIKLSKEGAEFPGWKYNVPGIAAIDYYTIVADDGSEAIFVRSIDIQVNAFNEYFAFNKDDRGQYRDVLNLPVNLRFVVVD